jgi:hypothetical protein
MFNQRLSTLIIIVLCLACGGRQETQKNGFPPADITESETFGEIIHDAQSQDTDIQPLCPSGQVLLPSDNCVTVPGDCRPWELPLTNGTCLPIGPRACPRNYDPESTADCEFGSLLECPEGFVIDESELFCTPLFAECQQDELPVPGGDCLVLGPASTGGYGFTFAECPNGQIPLSDGLCRTVGPRACPKLWDPESAVECVVGDVLPCPVGWSASPDGLLCNPNLLLCSPGEIPLFGGACSSVLPDLTECPEGPFAAVEDAESDIFYVAQTSVCISDCGTAEAPYPDLQTAIDAISDKGTVLVAAGIYSGNLSVSAKEVSIAGICPALTNLTGAVADTDGPALPLVTVNAGGSLWIDDVKLSGPGTALVVGKGSTAHLVNVEIDQKSDLGIDVSSGGTIHLSEVWLHGENASFTVSSPAGIRLSDGSSATLAGCLVEKCPGTCLLADGLNTVVTTSDSSFSRAQAVEGMVHTGGIIVAGGAVFTGEDLVLEENAGRGLLVEGVQSSAHLTRSVMRFNYSVGDSGGSGAEALSGSKLHVQLSDVNQNMDAGLRCAGAGSFIVVENSLVTSTQCAADGTHGGGISITDSCHASVLGSEFLSNRSTGISLTGMDTKVSVSYSLVANTFTDSSDSNGIGVLAMDGASVVLTNSAIERSFRYGAYLDGAESSIVMNESVIRDSAATSDSFSAGLVAFNGAEIEISASVFERNKELGIYVADPKTMLTMTDSEVRDTDLGLGELMGVGVSVMGATATLKRCTVSSSAIGGIAALDGIISLDRCLVADTRADLVAGDVGIGIMLVDSAVELSETRIISSAFVGIGLIGNVVLTGSKVAVTDIIPDWENNFETGVGGIVGTSGAVFSFSDLLVRNVGGAGLVSNATGTAGTVSRFLLDQVSPLPKFAGVGILSADGSTLDLSDGVVSRVAGLGVLSGSVGTLLRLNRIAVQDTASIPGATGSLQVGQGMLVQNGGQLDAFGVTVTGSKIVGVVSFSFSQTHLTGSILHDTQLTDELTDGHGLTAMLGATVDLNYSLVSNNSTAGVAAYSPGTTINITDSAITGTLTGGAEIDLGGEFQVFGDGIISADGGTVNVIRSVLAGNGRTGAYYFKGVGTLEDTVITGNASYGLAIQDTEDEVFHDGLGNVISGNALELSSAQAMEVTTSPGDLPVPPPPQMSFEF